MMLFYLSDKRKRKINDVTHVHGTSNRNILIKGLRVSDCIFLYKTTSRAGEVDIALLMNGKIKD